MSLERYTKVCLEGNFGDGTGTLVGIYASGFSNPTDRQVMYEDATHTEMSNVAFGGATKYSGNLKGILRPRQLKPILNSIFGNSSPVASPDGDAYTVDDPVSLVLEIGDEVNVGLNAALKYVGVGIKSLTLTANAKEFVTWSADWMAKSVTREIFAIPTGGSAYIPEDPIQWSGCALSLDGGTTSSLELKSFDMTIESNLRDDAFVLGSTAINKLTRNNSFTIHGNIDFTEREYSAHMSGLFGSDTTSLPDTNALGSGNLRFTMNNSSGALTAKIDLPIAIYEQTSQDISGRDEIARQITYRVIENSGNKWIVYD